MSVEVELDVGESPAKSPTIAISGLSSVESESRQLDIATASDPAKSTTCTTNVAPPGADPPAFGATVHVPDSVTKADPILTEFEQELMAAPSPEPSEGRSGLQPLGADATQRSTDSPATVPGADSIPRSARDRGSEDANDSASSTQQGSDQPPESQSGQCSTGEAAAMPPAEECINSGTVSGTTDPLAARDGASASSRANSPIITDTRDQPLSPLDGNPIVDEMVGTSLADGPEVTAGGQAAAALESELRHSSPETFTFVAVSIHVSADADEEAIFPEGSSAFDETKGKQPNPPDVTAELWGSAAASESGASPAERIESPPSHAPSQPYSSGASSPDKLEADGSSEVQSADAGQDASDGAVSDSEEGQPAAVSEAAAVPVAGLAPGHPLLARAQTALRAQLLATKARLEAELAESSKALKVQFQMLRIATLKERYKF